MPEEGAEVWTAGYPGLGDAPSWQLGKGNISNAILKVPELVDPSITTLIQRRSIREIPAAPCFWRTASPSAAIG